MRFETIVEIITIVANAIYLKILWHRYMQTKKSSLLLSFTGQVCLSLAFLLFIIGGFSIESSSNKSLSGFTENIFLLLILIGAILVLCSNYRKSRNT